MRKLAIFLVASVLSGCSLLGVECQIKDPQIDIREVEEDAEKEAE